MRGQPQRSQRMNERLDLLIEAYLDGSLDGSGAVELARVLRIGGEAALLVRERLAFAGLLGQALDRAGADDVARSVAERLDAHGQTSAFVRSVARSLPARRRRAPSPLPALTAAALVLVTVGVGWWMVQRSATTPASAMVECRIAGAPADGVIERVGARLPMATDAPLLAGDVVVAASAVAVRYGDGTRLMLGGGARLRVLAGSSGKS